MAETPAPTPSESFGAGIGDSTATVERDGFPLRVVLESLAHEDLGCLGSAGEPASLRTSEQVIVRFRLARSGSGSDVDVEVVSGAPGLESSARRALSIARSRFLRFPRDTPRTPWTIAVRFTVSEKAREGDEDGKRTGWGA